MNVTMLTPPEQPRRTFGCIDKVGMPVRPHLWQVSIWPPGGWNPGVRVYLELSWVCGNCGMIAAAFEEAQ